MSLVLKRSGDVVVLDADSAVVLYDRASKEITVVPDSSSPPPELNQSAEVCPNCGRTMPGVQSNSMDDYFVLLDQLSRENPHAFGTGTGTQEDQNMQDIPPLFGISHNSLSQGYFNRFFRKKKVLGRGSRATVYLVEHTLEGVSLGDFAMKLIPVGDDHAWLEKVLREVNMLRVLSHTNLVKYNHVWLEVSCSSRFGPKVPHAYVLQQFCNGGSLEEYIFQRKEGALSPPGKGLRRLSMGENETSASTRFTRHGLLQPGEIHSFISDITRGLLHLHNSGFLHCDLKPSNCLLEFSESPDLFPRVLLSDFGESQRVDQGRTGSGSTGTLEYCAPEVLIPNADGVLPQFSSTSDLFSLGMILYFLCFSELPYSDAWEVGGSLQQLKKEVCEFKFSFERSNALLRRRDINMFRPLLENLLGDASFRWSAQTVLEWLQAHLPGPDSRAKIAKVQKTWELRTLFSRLVCPDSLRLARLGTIYFVGGPPIVMKTCAVLAAGEIIWGRPVFVFVLHVCAVFGGWWTS